MASAFCSLGVARLFSFARFSRLPLVDSSPCFVHHAGDRSISWHIDEEYSREIPI